MGQPIRIRFKHVKKEILRYCKEHGQLDTCDEFKVSLTGLRNWLERPDVVGDADYGGLTTDTRPLGSTLDTARMAYFSAHEYRLSLMKQIQNLKRELQNNDNDIKEWERKILTHELCRAKAVGTILGGAGGEHGRHTKKYSCSGLVASPAPIP